jgi:hypothetical protein
MNDLEKPIDRSTWLPVDSGESIEFIQREMDRQGIKYAKLLEGKKIAILITLNKPYYNGHKSYDKIIYRK